jgi:hypothetical protein
LPALLAGAVPFPTLVGREIGVCRRWVSPYGPCRPLRKCIPASSPRLPARVSIITQFVDLSRSYSTVLPLRPNPGLPSGGYGIATNDSAQRSPAHGDAN